MNDSPRPAGGRRPPDSPTGRGRRAHRMRSSDMRAEKSRRGSRIGAALAAACAGLALVAWAATADAGDQPQTKPVDSAHAVVPILQARCAECPSAGKSKGTFSPDTRTAMLRSGSVVACKSGESELIDRVLSDDPDERMPQKGPKLTADEVGRLKSWIDQGAPWESGFTFKRSRYVAPL